MSLAAVLRVMASIAAMDTGGPIRNVVVMMLENRAFDHMLGFYGRDVDTRVDGLTGERAHAQQQSTHGGTGKMEQKENVISHA